MPRLRAAGKQVEAWDRQDRAAALRRDGWTWQSIADELGYSAPSGAVQAVRSAIRRGSAEVVDDLRQIELDRLDEVWARVMPIILNPPPLFQAGRLCTLEGTVGSDGMPMTVPDVRAVIDAANVIVRVSERKSRLVGADAPARRQVEVITDDLLREALQQHRAELERLQAEARSLGVEPGRLEAAIIDVEEVTDTGG